MTGATTRRGFLGAAAGGAALPAFARAATPRQTAPWPAKREVVRRGRALAVSPRGDRVLVAHDRRRSLAIGDRVVALEGMPLAVAIAHDGATGAVTTAFWDHPSLTLLDLASGAVRAKVDVGPAPGHVAFSHDGRRAIVAGGEQDGTLTVVDVAGARVLRAAQIGAVPRGLALTHDGRSAWVALQALDRVVRVDLRTLKVTRSIAVPPFPDRLALSPDGDRLLLTHADRRSTHVSEVDVGTRHVRRRAVGRRPAAVGFTARGRRVVAIGGGDKVVLLGARRRALAVGAAPRDMVVHGRRIWTVSDLTGEVTKVRA